MVWRLIRHLRTEAQPGSKRITWSQDNYAHPAQVHLRLKSIQRFTEGWEAMQRVYNAACCALDEYNSTGEAPPLLKAWPMRDVSLGGGPGFELGQCVLRAPLAARSADLMSPTSQRVAALRRGSCVRFNEERSTGHATASDWVEKIDLAVIPTCSITS